MVDTQRKAGKVEAAAGAAHKLAILLYFDPAQIQEIDRHWHRHGLKSRSETVRALVAQALRQAGRRTGK